MPDKILFDILGQGMFVLLSERSLLLQELNAWLWAVPPEGLFEASRHLVFSLDLGRPNNITLSGGKSLSVFLVYF